jgi:FkbM family methyltransferase
MRRGDDETFGLNFLGEVRSRLSGLKMETIFDVGAHIGITALHFSDEFPQAQIYAFEPGTENMKRLVANLVGKPDIKRIKCGLGAEVSKQRLIVDAAHPSMARISDAENGPSESIDIDTIDAYCSAQSIAKVDFMKIDTEGYEMSVLQGAKGMLGKGAIGLIKAEVALDPDSSYHTSLVTMSNFLHEFGYRLFGFYDQFENTLKPGPRLRRFDAAFIAPRFV